MKLFLLGGRGTLMLLALVSLLLLATVWYFARIARGLFAALQPHDGTGTFAADTASSTVNGHFTDSSDRHRRMQ